MWTKNTSCFKQGIYSFIQIFFRVSNFSAAVLKPEWLFTTNIRQGNQQKNLSLVDILSFVPTCVDCDDEILQPKLLLCSKHLFWRLGNPRWKGWQNQGPARVRFSQTMYSSTSQLYSHVGGSSRLSWALFPRAINPIHKGHTLMLLFPPQFLTC